MPTVFRSPRYAVVFAAAAALVMLPSTPAQAEDTTAPIVDYIGPSNTRLFGITIQFEDTNADAANTEVRVMHNGAEFTQYQREATNSESQNSNVLLLHFTTTVPDGNYEVFVKPRDRVGNVGPEVMGVVQKGEHIAQLNAYGDFQGGAETAAGDVDGDGIDEVITAAGPGGGPHVRVFAVDFVTHTTTPTAGWMAYAPEFHGGVRVATTDLDGDGTDEVITAPGPGGGPHVRAWHVNATGTVTEVGGFMAYDPKFTAGVYVAGGDVDGVSSAQEPARGEIIVGPGAGGGPHVRAFTSLGAAFTERCGFMAYDPRFTGGVRVAAIEITEDRAKEVATAAGPGGGPHVQVFNLKAGCSPPVVSSFMAFDPGFRGGVFISRSGEKNSNFDPLIVAAGPGGGPHVRLLHISPHPGSVTEFGGFMAYDPSFRGGVTAAGGDFDGDRDSDVVTTPGPGMHVTSVMRRWK